ncbi:MAG: hypothetical protein R3352_00980 [Salinisphaeraceae bacterium]|nr:hypothetical protein [Salinisphaeraceae bacterium]
MFNKPLDDSIGILSRAIFLSLCLLVSGCGDDEDEAGQGSPAPTEVDTTGGADEPGNDSNPPPAASCVPEWMGYPHLVGSIHEHSGYSDGEIGTTPVDYFLAGREAGLDFMASSDHSDNLRLPITANTDCLSPQLPECIQPPTPESPLVGVTKWEATGAIAEGMADEGFTAIRGFEWTSDRFGHINVFFSQNELNAKTSDGYLLSMEGFWLWFGLDPAIGGGSDGLLVFNHPGREDAIHSNIPDPAYTFNDFEFRPDAAERAVGIEVFGKSSDAYDVDNGAPPEGWYAFALDRGWRLGPVGAEDEHGTAWAQPERAKTILIAPDNSKQSIQAAMLQRRMYALAQNHNNLRLSFQADDELMGSEFSPPAGTEIELLGRVDQGMPLGGGLEIVSNAGEVVAQVVGSSLIHRVSVDENKRWYYLRVLNAEGQPVAYSSPIWLQAGTQESSCGSES